MSHNKETEFPYKYKIQFDEMEYNMKIIDIKWFEYLYDTLAYKFFFELYKIQLHMHLKAVNDDLGLKTICLV